MFYLFYLILLSYNSKRSLFTKHERRLHMETKPGILTVFSKISDFLLLNFLFLITSIPIVTLGASLTALYAVNLKMVKGEESYIYRDYFRAFKRNFKQGIPAFLLFAAAFTLLGMNIWISYQAPGLFFLVLRALSTIFMVCIFICMKYYFPILARFDFTSRQIWMHIPHMIVTHAGSFFFLVLLNFPVVFLSVYSLYTAAFVIITAAIFGFAIFTFIESFIYRKIFKDYEIM